MAVNKTKIRALHWYPPVVSLQVKAPVDMDLFLESHWEDIWWSDDMHVARREKDMQKLQESRSVRAFGEDCFHTKEYLAGQLATIKGEAKHTQQHMDISREQLRGLLTPNLMKGMKLGHRGLELGGLAMRMERSAHIVKQVLKKYEKRKKLFKNRREAFRSRRKEDTTLSDLCIKYSEVDRLWARVVALADQNLVLKK